MKISPAVLTPEDKQKLLLAGVGPLEGKEKGHDSPHFSKLTGEMLRKLVDAGAVSLEREVGAAEEEDGLPFAPEWDEPIFRNGGDAEKLAFLEKYPKFMAQGRIGNCGVGSIDIDVISSDTKLTKKEVIAFANLFGNADEFHVSDEGFRIDDGTNDQTKYFAHVWFD
jgi:hypothetical protein